MANKKYTIEFVGGTPLKKEHKLGSRMEVSGEELQKLAAEGVVGAPDGHYRIVDPKKKPLATPEKKG